MKVTVLAVGKLSKGEEAGLVARYEKRMRRLKPKMLELNESDKAREAGQILAKIGASDLVIALDERGDAPSSPAFAKLFAKAEETSRNIIIIIGGPDGLHESVRQRANHIICFGAMTWPHQLVRVLLAEQLYRAETILNGHPYHRV